MHLFGLFLEKGGKGGKELGVRHSPPHAYRPPPVTFPRVCSWRGKGEKTVPRWKPREGHRACFQLLEKATRHSGLLWDGVQPGYLAQDSSRAEQPSEHDPAHEAHCRARGQVVQELPPQIPSSDLWIWWFRGLRAQGLRGTCYVAWEAPSLGPGRGCALGSFSFPPEGAVALC